MGIARSGAKDKAEFPTKERMAELMKVSERGEGAVSWG
jgi:hypothetical protein